MKRVLLILIFSVAAQFHLSAQWDLFVPNQFSTYLWNETQVHYFKPDSLKPTEHGYIQYFNRKSGLPDDCWDELVNNEYSYSLEICDFYIPDSMIVRNDTVWFHFKYYDDKDSLFFLPKIEIGESFVSNSLTITCTDKYLGQVFGVEDSVKVFTIQTSPFQGKTFELSKSYGLLKNLPFADLAYHNTYSLYYQRLAGYRTLNDEKGYNQPDFEDYFHLSVGDTLVWERYIQPETYTEPPTTTYRIEIITDTFISLDSVFYEKKVLNFNGQWQYSHTNFKTEYFLRKNFTHIFTLPYRHYDGFDDFGFLWKNLDVSVSFSENDTLTFIQFDMDGKMPCQLYGAADVARFFTFSTKLGSTSSHDVAWGEDLNQIIGSIINGVHTGYTNIPSSIHKVSEEAIQMYPNPTNFDFQIQSDIPISSIVISDISGRLMYEGAVDGISVFKTFARGAYFVSVMTKNGIETIIIVKN